MHRFSLYRNFAGSFPKTEAFADSEITLPMYAGLKTADIDRVTSSLKESL